MIQYEENWEVVTKKQKKNSVKTAMPNKTTTNQMTETDHVKPENEKFTRKKQYTKTDLKQNDKKIMSSKQNTQQEKENINNEPRKRSYEQVKCRFGEKCARRQTCTFFHEGDTPKVFKRLCKYGRHCKSKDTNCIFSHDFPDDYVDPPPLKMKECNFGYECKFKDTTCIFSHDSPPKEKSSENTKHNKFKKECRFGYYCKYKDTCHFIHPENPPGQDIEEEKIEVICPNVKDEELFPTLSKNSKEETKKEDDNVEEKKDDGLSYKNIKILSKGITDVFIQEKNVDDIIEELKLFPDAKRILIKM